jgi:hypothetical protein
MPQIIIHEVRLPFTMNTSSLSIPSPLFHRLLQFKPNTCFFNLLFSSFQPQPTQSYKTSNKQSYNKTSNKQRMINTTIFTMKAKTKKLCANIRNNTITPEKKNEDNSEDADNLDTLSHLNNINHIIETLQ